MLISKVLNEENLKQIVDLGSGAGGSMPDVMKVLKETYQLDNVRLLMTDRYPNQDIVEMYNQLNDPSIAYETSSVDATDILHTPPGLKTMINSFHHMRPREAKKILASAATAKQSLLIYEMGENKLPLLIWWLLLPLSLTVLIIMVFFMTPFVRPLNWQQLVFTYLIPIIPICYAWDGQASLPRMYSMSDIDQLLGGIGSDGYSWQKGHALKKNGKKLGTFVLGLPE